METIAEYTSSSEDERTSTQKAEAPTTSAKTQRSVTELGTDGKGIRGQYISKRRRLQRESTPVSATALQPLFESPLAAPARSSWRVCRSVVCTYEAHGAQTSCSWWSPPDGQVLLTASMDGLIRLWRPLSRTGELGDSRKPPKCLRELRHHEAAVRDAKWTCGGTTLLSCGFDKTSCLVDAETGSCTQVFRQEAFATVVCPHPFQRDLFLTGSSSAQICCWDARQDSGPAKVYEGAGGSILDIEFISEGREFVASSDQVRRLGRNNTMSVWDFDHQNRLAVQIYPELYTCPSVCAHPDGDYFVAQSSGGYIAVFSAHQPYRLQKRKEFRGHFVGGYGIHVDISPDGSLVASGAGDGKVHLYDWARGRQRKVFALRKEAVVGTAFHPIWTSTLACCGWDGTVSILQ